MEVFEFKLILFRPIGHGQLAKIPFSFIRAKESVPLIHFSTPDVLPH
jgi:hypothetical protein